MDDEKHNLKLFRETEDFVKEFNDLLKKYNIEDLYAFDWDTEISSVIKAYALSIDEKTKKKFLYMSYSKLNTEICPSYFECIDTKDTI